MMKGKLFLLGAVLIGAIMAGCAKEPAPKLVGTEMTKTVQSIDFSLVDQKGAAYRLSSSKGKVVVLSFIYTHCDDICPFVAMKIKDARAILGPLAAKVDFVAVTTDPERDTPEVIAAYSKEAGLDDQWHFVTGPATDVKKVWADFGIGVHRVEESGAPSAGGSGMSMGTMDDEATKGLSPTALELGKAIGQKFGGATRSRTPRLSGSSIRRALSALS